MIILINTCDKNIDKTCPMLIRNLVNIGGVPEENIHIVCGECDFAEICKDDYFIVDNFTIKLHRVPYCNIDNNALLWLANNSENGAEEWAYYLHDTCEVLDGFYQENCKILNDELEVNPDLLAIIMHKPYSMCIGHYNINAIKNNAEKVKLSTQYVSLDKSIDGLKRTKGNVEDRVFKALEKIGKVKYLWGAGRGGNAEVVNGVDVYSTGKGRRKEIYHGSRVVKFKANHNLQPKNFIIEL